MTTPSASGGSMQESCTHGYPAGRQCPYCPPEPQAASLASYRTLNSRLAIVESEPGTSLVDHLLRTAEAVETVEREECKGSEGVSHAVVEWEGGDCVWTTLLVIE